jgi:predicted nucleic acid-binding Zn ribbon protein
LLPRPAIIFKGSGFYVTDHGRNGAGRPQRKRHQEKAQEPVSVSSTEEEPAP